MATVPKIPLKPPRKPRFGFDAWSFAVALTLLFVVVILSPVLIRMAQDPWGQLVLLALATSLAAVLILGRKGGGRLGK